MRFDSVIYLISTVEDTNSMGDPIDVLPRRREVFAKKDSVRRSEFYQAAATGFKPEITFVTWNQQYEGEEKLEYDGKVYSIIRTYQKNDKEIELVCSRLVNEVS
ncbi:phage head closure protein [Cytobacillus praedii]|uniref:Head-tail adaptor protein n=1 Tax=Cytobacillus praedii TaxID=1742358 RepID=A0A4R1B4M8_9BACI|nr:phage head closure protein [Cytobacillus praedii]TCJ05047.1 hypothetical protein E0Y62_07470 [Cytobacillus praedii]